MLLQKMLFVSKHIWILFKGNPMKTNISFASLDVLNMWLWLNVMTVGRLSTLGKTKCDAATSQCFVTHQFMLVLESMMECEELNL